MNQQKGQVLIEYVLLLAVAVLLWGLLRSGLNNMQFAERVLSSPWGRMAGMIETGVMEEPRDARQLHPGHLTRNLTEVDRD